MTVQSGAGRLSPALRNVLRAPDLEPLLDCSAGFRTKDDRVFPVETSQKPMFTFLDTPTEHKKHILYDGGHGFAGSQLASDALDWLDKYLGPVN